MREYCHREVPAIFTYKTVEEKAAQWSLSVRYVQGLCRKGKVEGAVKKGGVWFIPETAPCPSKSDEEGFRFSGTKKKLFEKAVTLFAERSYESVTIKDIADEVGVASSAFYNHFKSKSEILDAIYGYFQHYHALDRPSLDDLEDVLINGSLMDVLRAVYYNFNDDYMDTLIGTMKIVMQRMFIEERAKTLYREVILESGIDYSETIYKRAVELGRFPEGTDIHALSVLCNMSRHYYLLAWISNSKLLEEDKLGKSQYEIYEMILSGLTRR